MVMKIEIENKVDLIIRYHLLVPNYVHLTKLKWNKQLAYAILFHRSCNPEQSTKSISPVAQDSCAIFPLFYNKVCYFIFTLVAFNNFLYAPFYLNFKGRHLDTEKLFAYRAVSRSLLSM